MYCAILAYTLKMRRDTETSAFGIDIYLHNTKIVCKY